MPSVSARQCDGKNLAGRGIRGVGLFPREGMLSELAVAAPSVADASSVGRAVVLEADKRDGRAVSIKNPKELIWQIVWSGLYSRFGSMQKRK